MSLAVFRRRLKPLGLVCVFYQPTLQAGHLSSAGETSEVHRVSLKPKEMKSVYEVAVSEGMCRR